jgi:ribonuclease P protein component
VSIRAFTARHQRFVLTRCAAVRTLPGPFFVAFQGLSHETYLSAEQGAPSAHARISSPYGHQEWAQGIEPPARQGPTATHSLTPRPRRRGDRARALGCGSSLLVTIVPTFALRPRLRLRRAADFRQLYASGRRLGNELFTAVVRPNQLATPRLGMSVAARSVRRAVDRNRVRRVIRESFRARASALPPLDIVIGVRHAAQDATNARLRESLDRLWQKLASTCERWSRS